MGLVQQVIDRAPRWLVRKLTATYLTVGLADIAREVGIESEVTVRELIVDMVRRSRIAPAFVPLTIHLLSVGRE